MQPVQFAGEMCLLSEESVIIEGLSSTAFFAIGSPCFILKHPWVAHFTLVLPPSVSAESTVSAHCTIIIWFGYLVWPLSWLTRNTNINTFKKSFIACNANVCFVVCKHCQWLSRHSHKCIVLIAATSCFVISCIAWTANFCVVVCTSCRLAFSPVSQVHWFWIQLLPILWYPALHVLQIFASWFVQSSPVAFSPFSQVHWFWKQLLPNFVVTQKTLVINAGNSASAISFIACTANFCFVVCNRRRWLRCRSRKYAGFECSYFRSYDILHCMYCKFLLRGLYNRRRWLRCGLASTLVLNAAIST